MEATRPERRRERPWIITMGHRPMYCSNNDRDDCTMNESIVRKGIPLVHLYGLEDLFYKYGVDLEFWAHEHSYERLWPVYDRKGCQEKLDPFVKNPSDWSAVRYSDYGYTLMTLHNKTHLTLQQFSVENVSR
ncbi:hypothetical protein HPB48_013408 [Haemaphysalis longicornis]|uniref:Purple acid phosphatase n=1 Tax=Haemaphysalis longicornis TaxID=44386 RepID=A0A9J6GG85_HAELO|nr:hypothetical protein HPB48_013408 [Haemaphysalis longicornis]